MVKRIDAFEVRKTFAYESYRRMFEEYGIPTITPGDFSSFSATVDKGAPVVIVQTQGLLPKVRYDGNTTTLGPFERGWVQSGVDTGGQTYYILDQAMALAKLGQHVIILGQRFGDFPKYLAWYNHPTTSGSVEIVRIPAGGIQEGPDGRAVKDYPFVRKEDLYPHLYGMAVDATAIGLLRGAWAFMGGYADGGVIAVAAAQALGRPSAFVAHSMGLRKLQLMGLDPRDPASYFGPDLWFGPRLQAERASFLSAHLVVANTPDEEGSYGTLYGIEVPNHHLLTPGVNRLFFPDNRESASQEKETARKLMEKNGLERGKFFVSWGRIAASKNLAGEVRILGELRKLYPGEYDDVKLVIIGGNPEHPEGEEKGEMDKVRQVAESYRMEIGDDIVRIGDLQPGVIAWLANEAIAYLGTQFHEPFGMVSAEMLAIGGNGFVVVPEVAGFAKWLKMQGYDDVAVVINLGQQGNAVRVDLQRYKEAAQAIHDFRNHPDLREKIHRGARLADTSFRWKAQAAAMLDLLREEAEDRHDRPSLHLAMPAWYEPPRPVRRERRTSVIPEWAASGTALARSPGPLTEVLGSDELVKVARDIGMEIASWLKEAGDQARQLITVAGNQAALLADILAAAIDAPESRVQRVAGQAWEGGTPEEVKAAAKAKPLRPAHFQPFGGMMFVEEGARAVVTDVGVGDVNGDVNIVSGKGGALSETAHVIITGGQVLYNPSNLPPFMANPTLPLFP